MAETRARINEDVDPTVDVDRRKGLFAAGGMVGAILASSCCILPLVFVTLGISGAWIGTLTALEPYKAWFAGATLVFLGLGFRQVYFRSKPVCADGSYCARPESSVITMSTLWLATALVAIAMTIEWWAPLFY